MQRCPGQVRDGRLQGIEAQCGRFTATAGRQHFALNIDMHWDLAADANNLVELKRFAIHCCEHFFRDKNYNYLLAMSDRFHNETGIFNIIVVTRKAVVTA